MAEQFYTILTKLGKAKIANATALGTKVNLTKFQVGDGNGSYYNPTEDQTQLRNKVWESNISSITVDENNPNWIVLETIIPGDVGGFMIREAAALDDEGNMIAVGKYPETYKPVVGDGSTKDLIIKMILEVSNTSNVTLKVDPTVILATQKDIQVLNNKIENIKVPVTSVNEKTGAIVLSAEDIKTKNGQSVESSLSETTKEIYGLKSSVDSGKDSLYSAIIGKKVTPRSKDFADLVKGVKDIKLGQGNAQPGDVLSGKTFTNDDGIIQKGSMTNYGSKTITPTTYTQTFGNGYYDSIKINALSDSVLQSNFPDIDRYKLPCGVSIGGIYGAIRLPLKFQRDLPLQSTFTYTYDTKFNAGDYKTSCSVRGFYRYEGETHSGSTRHGFTLSDEIGTFKKQVYDNGESSSTLYIDFTENQLSFTFKDFPLQAKNNYKEKLIRLELVCYFTPIKSDFILL